MHPSDRPDLVTLTTPQRHVLDRGSLVGHLRAVADSAVDVVAPQSAVTVTDVGTAVLAGAEPFLLSDGVYPSLHAAVARGAYRDLAARLGVPLPYLDRLDKDGHGDLAAVNLNTLASRDSRTALYRFLRASDGFLLRAVLSDRYGVMDNLDAFVTIAQGLTDAGVDLDAAEVEADWSPDRFRMRVALPDVALAVPDLLADYRPLYSMRAGAGVHEPAAPGEAAPLLWAGLEFTNSETGGGRFTLAPRAVVMICRNGLTRSVEFARTHLGAQLEQGAITWGEETQRRQRDLILAMVADAARSFCSVGYLERQAAAMRVARGLTVVSPTAAVEVLGRQLAFTDGESRRVLDAFVGSSGAGSVLDLAQAVTLAAQGVADTDRQSEMEQSFWNIVGPLARTLAEASA